MSKGKEFFEYCAKNPEVLETLKGKKGAEAAEYIKAQGFEMDESDIRDFMELCSESNDEQLASMVSGGSCAGHCGKTCESDERCRRDGCFDIT